MPRINTILPPKWNPQTREWIIDYTVIDENIGWYVQRVRCEALVSAQRYVELLKQRKEQCLTNSKTSR